MIPRSRAAAGDVSVRWWATPHRRGIKVWLSHRYELTRAEMEGACKDGAPCREVSHEIPSLTIDKHRPCRSGERVRINIRTKVVNIRHREMNYFAITFAADAHSLSTVSFCETSNDTKGAWPQPRTRMARKSFTLVRVGPVTTRPPIAAKKL
jgi:hypothetical protein